MRPSKIWAPDYKRFRVWLFEKYAVKKAYIFIGLIPKNKNLYAYLQECGFVLIFKEVVYGGRGKPKGNCDADLVLQAARDYFEKNFDKALIVSSDGDYASLVRFLREQNKLLGLLSPAPKEKCSILLKRINAKIYYIKDKRSILEARNKKAPNMDETTPGSFS